MPEREREHERKSKRIRNSKVARFLGEANLTIGITKLEYTSSENAHARKNSYYKNITALRKKEKGKKSSGGKWRDSYAATRFSQVKTTLQ